MSSMLEVDGSTSSSALPQGSEFDGLEARLTRQWAHILSTSRFVASIEQGQIDKLLFAIYMLETYHYTSHNARNQAAVGVVAKDVSPQYQKFCFEHAAEETGHELMALHDVQTLGLNMEAIDLRRPLPETETLIAYLYWISVTGNPVRRLGYSYWAESVYKYITPLIQKVQSTLQLKASQLTFFISHSEIDAAHAEEVKRMLLRNCRTPEDWAEVRLVMETSLRLTFGLMEAVHAEYERVRDGKPSAYSGLLQLLS